MPQLPFEANTAPNTMSQPYLILKYYSYTKIDDPTTFRHQHHLHCLEQYPSLRGRIKVSHEGINGTLCGTTPHCQGYMGYLRTDPRFAGIQFNVTPTPRQVHQKLHVRLKPEIVHSGLHHLMPSPNREERHYIDARTFQTMRQDPNVIVLDVRSRYEHSLGKFKGSLTLDIENFREFPEKLAACTLDKTKTYITLCTRGIKSEKARDYLKQVLKIPNVYQLEGGILDYAQSTNGEGFEGVCYVFDERVTVPINQKDPSIISHCYLCHTPSARMVNCANFACNRHAPICEPCGETHQGACSASCKETNSRRPYDGTGYYLKKTNGYNPRMGSYRHDHEPTTLSK